MQFAYASLTLLQLIGFAALLGGVLVQLGPVEPEINRTMLIGAPLMLVSFVALWALGGSDASVAPQVVRTLVLVFACVLVVLNRKFASIPRGLLVLLGLLALADAAIAVYWT